MSALKPTLGGKQSLSMAQIIGHQFKGGSRNIKRLEMRLSRLGILPAGMYVAPGRGKVSQYGNMHRGDVTAIFRPSSVRSSNLAFAA